MRSEIALKQQRLFELCQKCSPAGQELINTSYKFAKKVHRTQRKFDADRYILHPLTIAVNVIELFGSTNADQIAAALLHDVIEDTATTKRDVEQATNKNVAELVQALTIPGIKQATEAEKYQLKSHHFLTQIKPGSKWLHQIALADKLDNISRAWHLSGRQVAERRSARWLKEAEAMRTILPSAPPLAREIFSRALERLRAVVSAPSSKPLLVLIGGMPVTGKSTTAIQLAAKLGVATVISTDEIRQVMQLHDRSERLHGKTHDRWQLFGPFNQTNLKKGLFAHAESVKAGVQTIINKSAELNEPIIIEGVHLVPSLYQDIASHRVYHVILKPHSPGFHHFLMSEKARRRQTETLYSKGKIAVLHRLQRLLVADALSTDTAIIPSGPTAADQIFRLISTPHDAPSRIDSRQQATVV